MCLHVYKMFPDGNGVVCIKSLLHRDLKLLRNYIGKIIILSMSTVQCSYHQGI